jgi:hypothetical protein
MSRATLKKIIYEITPPWLLKLGKRVLTGAPLPKIRSDTGQLFLKYAREFSATVGGKPEAFDRSLDGLIGAGDSRCVAVCADLLDAFMPGYERNLFQYYIYQQYYILFRFLQYPFLYPLAVYTASYQKGLSLLDEAHVLDYGCGVPYGLIMTLLSEPQRRIKSVTLVDLDLIHMDFAEFVIRKIAPDMPLDIYRLRDTEVFPGLKGPYNFFFGKDIFEHLLDPEEKLRRLMSYSADASVCYFDFGDKGPVIYQHITPDLRYLAQVMERLGFQASGQLSSLTEFRRNI